ncbi:ABC transporter permease [Bacillus sp. FSL W7-1321]
MFLAINEMKHSKLRYALVIGVMFLIAYLVFFLTGLAYGLAQENRMVVDKWDADHILLAEESNNNLNMSMVSTNVFDDVSADEKAILAQTAGVITQEDVDEKVNVQFFGIVPDQFLVPNIIEGEMFTNDNETVADVSLKEQYGLSLGDRVTLAGNDKELTIIGFTDDAKFNVSPVLYTSIRANQEIRFDQPETVDEAPINAIVTRGQLNDTPDELETVNIATFINELPGYSAQVLTFGFMIGFLIIIAAIVIGIFVYVLTMQKSEIFGVMKAQGISSRYISTSVIAQTFLLTALGVMIGLLSTLGTSLLLPEAVPFQIKIEFFTGISGLIIVIAVLGAFFSVRSIVKIDPLKAIG